MTAWALRDTIMAYVADANEDQLQKIYSILSDKLPSTLPKLTKEQLELLDNEREQHISGQSKSFSWDEVKGNIRKKRAS